MPVTPRSVVPRRAVNLSLSEGVVHRARRLTGNLSEQVERLLEGWVEEEEARRAEAERSLDRAVEGWNAFGDRVGSFADEHSTL